MVKALLSHQNIRMAWRNSSPYNCAILWYRDEKIFTVLMIPGKKKSGVMEEKQHLQYRGSRSRSCQRFPWSLQIPFYHSVHCFHSVRRVRSVWAGNSIYSWLAGNGNPDPSVSGQDTSEIRAAPLWGLCLKSHISFAFSSSLEGIPYLNHLEEKPNLDVCFWETQCNTSQSYLGCL